MKQRTDMELRRLGLQVINVESDKTCRTIYLDSNRVHAEKLIIGNATDLIPRISLDRTKGSMGDDSEKIA